MRLTVVVGAVEQYTAPMPSKPPFGTHDVVVVAEVGVEVAAPTQSAPRPKIPPERMHVAVDSTGGSESEALKPTLAESDASDELAYAE